MQEVSIPIDLTQVGQLAKDFVHVSQRMVDGAPGAARPGGHCQVCPHRQGCPDAVGTELVHASDADTGDEHIF